MILTDDKRAPPPPYASAAPLRRTWNGTKLSDLPPNLLLHVVEDTFPPYVPQEGLAAQRRNLYWLTISLRLVNRGLFIACMHVLRSAYVDTYISLVKPPYTSDPFPLGFAEASDDAPAYASTSQPIRSVQRETEVLDLFISLKAREDVWLDQTDLHLEREESFNDIFSLMQPRRRMEDLLRYHGVRYGYITLSDSPSSRQKAIPFSQLSISFSARKIGLVLLTPATHPSSRRVPQTRTTILECARSRDEKLEVTARALAKALGPWMAENL